MSVIEIVPATEAHARAVAAHMRLADVLELTSLGHADLNGICTTGVEVSRYAWAGLVDGAVACIFGVAGASLLSRTGHPWLLGTDLIEANAGAFLKRNRVYVRRMRMAFPHLVNWVYAENLKAIDWLHWLGFDISDPQPWGPLQKPFCRFEMGEP